MKKFLFFLALAMFSFCFSLAQQAVLKGTVIDTTEKKNLTNSVVSLLRKSDSLLTKYRSFIIKAIRQPSRVLTTDKNPKPMG